MAQMTVEQLHGLLWGFGAARAVTVAARTGLLGLLSERAATPEEAAAALGLAVGATGKLLRALCAHGVLAAEGEAYRVAGSLAEHLRPGEGSLLPYVAHAHHLYDGWGGGLEPWVRGDGWPTRRSGQDPAAFGAAMRAAGTHLARRVVERLDLAGVRRILDIGGGFGHMARVLCDAAPGATATVGDREEVAELARQETVGTEDAGRLTFVGGSYLEPYPGGPYDLALLANVLHQESEPQAARLVQLAADALAPGGRVAVVDFAIDDARREHRMGTLFAINMRDFGDTWPAPTIHGWLRAAGLVDPQTVALDEDRWLITARRT